MTEAEWLASADPKPMLRFLLGTNHPRVQDIESFPDCRTSDRKLRLFACACYNRIRHFLPNAIAQAAVEVGEQFADGLVPAEELQKAETSIRRSFEAIEEQWMASQGAERITLQPTHDAFSLALVVLWAQAPKAAYYASSNAYYASAAITNIGGVSYDGEFSSGPATEARAQTYLLRDIFGHLFLPISLSSSWLTSTVVAMAQQMYDSRDFSAMPILADALQDAECEDAAILNHCRGPGPHVKGCFVVDLLLGKK